MTALLAAIADDYTGASDLANTWRKAGLRTVQTIGIPSDVTTLKDIDAVVVSLKIRSAPADEAVSRALAAETLLRDIGVGHVMYKVCSTFDSTDDGNIGQVTDALLERTDQEWVVVTPAFPETGRTVYKGNLFVNDAPLNESPLRNHPLNPMHDANLARVLEKQSQRPARVLDFQTVTAGVEACLEKIASISDGRPSIIADAINDADLQTLGRLTLRTKVSTGASGLGYGLARAALDARMVESRAAGGLRPAGGLSAAIAGSCSARTLEQIAFAESHMPVLRLDPERIVTGTGVIEEALASAREHLGRGPVLVAASASPEVVAAVQEKCGKHEAGLAIERTLAEVAEGLVNQGVRRLVVAGGETSGSVVDRLAIRSFQVGDELAPGVPMLRTIGQSGGDLMVALKSGNFGGVDFFPDALLRLT